MNYNPVRRTPCLGFVLNVMDVKLLDTGIVLLAVLHCAFVKCCGSMLIRDHELICIASKSVGLPPFVCRIDYFEYQLFRINMHQPAAFSCPTLRPLV